MTLDVQEKPLPGKCPGCARAWEDEPNALCNRLVHWHAWTARLRDALREALELAEQAEGCTNDVLFDDWHKAIARLGTMTAPGAEPPSYQPPAAEGWVREIRGVGYLVEWRGGYSHEDCKGHNAVFVAADPDGHVYVSIDGNSPDACTHIPEAVMADVMAALRGRT